MMYYMYMRCMGSTSHFFLIYLLSCCSFLDDAFRKNLESALRFGNPLLVQVKSSVAAYVHTCTHSTIIVCFLLIFLRLFTDFVADICYMWTWTLSFVYYRMLRAMTPSWILSWTVRFVVLVDVSSSPLETRTLISLHHLPSFSQQETHPYVNINVLSQRNTCYVGTSVSDTLK